MRALWLVLALAACSGGAAPKSVAHVAAADEGVRITRVPPAAGDRRTGTSVMHMDADVAMPDGSTRPIIIDDVTHEEIEVLEVSGGTEQKVRVTYPRAHRTRVMGPELRSDEDKPVAGHHYVVWIEAGEIHATRDDGAALHEAEEKHLVDAWDDDLGHADPLLVLIADSAWTLGVRRELKPDELAGLDFGDDETRVSAASIELAGTSADTATFELDVVMHSDDGGSSIDIAGRVVLEIERRTGRGLSMTIKGTMKGGSDGMTLTGAIEGSQRWTYP
jgi:hypothetical protein